MDYATLIGAIEAAAAGPGTLNAHDADGRVERTTWAAAHERALRMAAVLVDHGAGPGGRVGLLADTGIDCVTALQAVWLTGAAVSVLPLPTRAGQSGHVDRLRAVAADADLGLVVVGDPMRDAGPALAARTRVLALDELAAWSDQADPATPAGSDPSDLAVLQYTSGSTRTPRGVPVRHDHLVANLLAIRHAIDHDAHHPYPVLSWLPLYHDMGLFGFCALPMSCGCPLVLQPTACFARRPASWLGAVARHRAQVTGAPNFAYAVAARTLGTGPPLDLSAVRALISGGEPVDAAMMADFARAGRRHGLDPAAITPAYGLAESTLAVALSPAGGGLRVDRVDPVALETRGRAVPAAPGRGRELVRLGPPVRGSSVRVTDRATGAVLGDRAVGRVEVRGPSVVGHYWGEPPPVDPWLRTGDLGYLAEGDLVVCGREKDLLLAAGRNVHPQDVEAAAAAVPAVRPGGVAAFGVPHGADQRLVVAVESARPDDAALLRGRVAAAVVDEVGLAPSAVLVLPPGRLPRTTSGKLRRAETRSRYLSGELTGPREGRSG